jgi:hypothetical protein
MRPSTSSARLKSRIRTKVLGSRLPLGRTDCADQTCASPPLMHVNMHRRGSGWTAKAASSTNIFVEQLWRSLEYECVYLHASVPACWETGSEARAGVRKCVAFYNHKRPHSSLGGQPPAVIYWQRIETTSPDQQVQKVAKFNPDSVQLTGGSLVLVRFTRPYRARCAVHRSSLKPLLVGCFRWGQAGAGD